MVEGTIFLHENYNMFGVEISAARCRLDGQRPKDRLRDSAQRTGGPCQLRRATDELSSSVHGFSNDGDWFRNPRSLSVVQTNAATLQ